MATKPKPDVAALGAVTTAPAKDLRLADNNPRKITDRAIEVVSLSLQRFGWQQPLVIDGDNAVIAGHTRLLAARKLGLKDVPVVIASGLTEQEVEAYRIADNRTHDFTTWDLPLPVEQLDALAPDFADVLALADWETIVADFENMQNAADLDVPDDVDSTLNAFSLTVCFKTKEEALAAEQTIIDLPGVFDVRHKL